MRQLILTLLICGLACTSGVAADLQDLATKERLAKLPEALVSWLGIYATPREISGYTRSVLSIEPGLDGKLQYRLLYQSDVDIQDSIKQDVYRGDLIVEGENAFVPVAEAYMKDGKVQITSRVQKYTKITLKGTIALFREDSLLIFKDSGKLYDYGILIRLDETEASQRELEDLQLKSIKILYHDPTMLWKDPFVEDANEILDRDYKHKLPGGPVAGEKDPPLQGIFPPPNNTGKGN
jgi:hypothetical protein